MPKEAMRSTRSLKHLSTALIEGAVDVLEPLMAAARMDVTSTALFWAFPADADAGLPAVTCLHVAAHFGCVLSVKWLLDRGADPMACDTLGRTSIDVASSPGVLALLTAAPPVTHAHSPEQARAHHAATRTAETQTVFSKAALPQKSATSASTELGHVRSLDRLVMPRKSSVLSAAAVALLERVAALKKSGSVRNVGLT